MLWSFCSNNWSSHTILTKRVITSRISILNSSSIICCHFGLSVLALSAPHLALTSCPLPEAMAAMKAMKAAKAMKAMKAKRISKIAKGKLSKAMVFRGSKERTVSGLNKAALLKNKRGKVVSKKQNAAGKRAYKHIQSWTNAVKAARKELKVRGFVAVNGKTQQGKAIYVKAKAILAAQK